MLSASQSLVSRFVIYIPLQVYGVCMKRNCSNHLGCCQAIDSLVVIFLVIKIMSCHATSDCIGYFGSSRAVGVLHNVLQISVFIGQGALDTVQIHHMIKPFMICL